MSAGLYIYVLHLPCQVLANGEDIMNNPVIVGVYEVFFYLRGAVGRSTRGDGSQAYRDICVIVYDQYRL